MKSVLIFMFAGLTLATTPMPNGSTSEIGGRVYGLGPVAAAPADVLVYSDSQCVAGTRTTADGRYYLSLSPGVYTFRVDVGGEDVAIETVRAEPGSWQLDIDANFSAPHADVAALTLTQTHRAADGPARWQARLHDRPVGTESTEPICADFSRS